MLIDFPCSIVLLRMPISKRGHVLKLYPSQVLAELRHKQVLQAHVLLRGQLQQVFRPAAKLFPLLFHRYVCVCVCVHLGVTGNLLVFDVHKQGDNPCTAREGPLRISWLITVTYLLQ